MKFRFPSLKWQFSSSNEIQIEDVIGDYMIVRIIYRVVEGAEKMTTACFDNPEEMIDFLREYIRGSDLVDAVQLIQKLLECAVQSLNGLEARIVRECP